MIVVALGGETGAADVEGSENEAVTDTAVAEGDTASSPRASICIHLSASMHCDMRHQSVRPDTW